MKARESNGGVVQNFGIYYLCIIGNFVMILELCRLIGLYLIYGNDVAEIKKSRVEETNICHYLVVPHHTMWDMERVVRGVDITISGTHII